MIHGYLYSDDTVPIAISLNIENKLSEILIDKTTHITIGYDSVTKSFRLFNTYNNGTEFDLKSTNDTPTDILKILDKNCYNVSNDKNNPVFEYLYLTDTFEVKTYKIDIIAALETISKIEITDSKIKYKFDSYIESENNIIKSIIINKLKYIYLYDYQKNNLNIINYYSDDTYTFDLSNDKFINKDSLYYTHLNSDNELSLKTVPLFCSKYQTTNSVLFFIDFENNSIERKIIFETYKISNKIIKVDLKSEKKAYFNLSIFTRYNDKVSVLSFVMSNFPVEKESHILDSDLIIDSGLEKDKNNSLYINIKSYEPSYHGENKPVFQIQKINTDNISSTTCDKSEEVSMQSVDNKKVYNEISYGDEKTINRLSVTNEKTRITNILDKAIEQPKNLYDLDYFTSDIKSIDENLSKENEFVQEFSSDGVRVAAFINTDDTMRNTLEISSKETLQKNNIPIEIEKPMVKINNESITDSGFETKQINSLAVNVNEFNEIIFPFLNIAFKRFGNFIYQKMDMDIMYPLYNDYVILSKRSKLESQKYNKYSLGNEKINEIIDFVYAKFRENEANYISKDQIARFVSDTFKSVKTGNKIYLSDQNGLDLYKYINRYDGYQLL